MIKLKVSLNSSAGGVLYHYCSVFKDVVSIVDNGMRPSNNFEEAPHSAGMNGNPQPFISFSRTRDNPARIGFATGGGIVYSKDLLSDLGKFEAFHHGGDNHEGNQIQVLMPNPSAASIDTAKSQVIRFELKARRKYVGDESVYTLYLARAEIPLSNGDTTWENTDIDSAEEGEELQQWVARNKANLLDFQTKTASGGYQITEFKIKMSIDNDAAKLPKSLQKAIKKTLGLLDEYKKDNAGEEGYFYIKAPFFDSTGFNRSQQNPRYPWVKMQNSPQFDYEDLLGIIEKTRHLEDEGDPNADVSYYDASHQQIIATIPTSLFGKSYRDLPPTLQTILTYQKWNETEDRLWLNPRFVQGSNGHYKPIPETRKAVIGIIVPDDAYFSTEVEEFRKTHPNLPVYAYTDNNKKKAPGVPPEAYRSPVA